ncbi:MAG: dTDP-4-dehydrorhamnose 3,5-epimerase [Chitinophagales bacterium]|nr:dTDP-4-dehydrorhamnose 3,5-epimerase [Chitinophagales bacterium]MDW8427580.1 dTDP-4-dehydrorhamnose 3,5-epimerase [Chitinophagales bacterium]
MKIEIESTHLSGGVVVLRPEVFRDERGFFKETFREDIFKQLGLPHQFVQHNHSGSVRNVVRGLHFQWDPPMGKLMRVTVGSAFLVAVDLRKGSPTFGQWYGREVSADNHLMIWAPASFARGFAVTSDYAEIQYICTGIYNQNGEGGIRWNDPQIGVQWPVQDPILSLKDQNAPLLHEWIQRPESNYFRYDTKDF